MSYSRTCPHCGTRLNPGEQCDCRSSLLDRAKDLLTRLSDVQLDWLLAAWENDTARSADDTTDGRETTHDT